MTDNNPPSEPKPVNIEALAALFNRQAAITRALYHQRVMVRLAPVEAFSAFDAEELRKQFQRERRTLRRIAARLEEVTGRQLPPLELYYTG